MESLRFCMFWPQAVSLSQERFPTLLCSNLTFQSASFPMALPDHGQKSRAVPVAAGRAVSLLQSWERPLLWAWPREWCRAWVHYGWEMLTQCDWGWCSVSLQNTPTFTSISAFAPAMHKCVFFISLSCAVCFSFSFFSLKSCLCLFCLLTLVQCVFPLWSSSKIAAPILHDQLSAILTLLEHWTMWGAQPPQQTWWMNLILFISLLLCYRKGCPVHEDLRLASHASPGGM